MMEKSFFITGESPINVVAVDASRGLASPSEPFFACLNEEMLADQQFFAVRGAWDIDLLYTRNGSIFVDSGRVSEIFSIA